jgi:hypothetical protein
MRTTILALAALVLVSVSGASASIVIHDGQPGIVATRDNHLLDSMGMVWQIDQGWVRHSELDPPVPVADILSWDVWYLVTTEDRFWKLEGPDWVNHGVWPGLSAITETDSGAAFASPKTIPNPSAGSCRVAFQTAAIGPVSVLLFDASGRLVRQLHDGPLPIGEFSLSWDGRDDGGQDLPSGVFFAKVTTPAGESTAKLILAP